MENERHKRDILSLLHTFTDAAIYAKEINGNRTIKLNENRPYFTASCFKVITAIALYRKLEREKKSDDLMLPFGMNERVPGSGILKSMRPHSNSVYNHMVLMLKLSDNTAADLLLNYVTKKYQDETIGLLGLKKTRIRQNCREACAAEFGLQADATPEMWDAECIRRKAVHAKNAASLQPSKANVSTTYELHRVLEELVTPKIISEKSAQKIMNVLKLYDPDDRILEFGSYIEVAHKGGWMSTVRADMGVVFAENPFYLVLMGKKLTNPEKTRFMDSYTAIVKSAMKHFAG